MRIFPTYYIRKKIFFLFFLIILFITQGIYAQVISVDNNRTPQQLIENNLIQGCVEVSNINSQINGSVNGLGSFGYFERDLSNFPFDNGIVLSTGNATSAGNTVNVNILNEGETTWGPDPDLETALGISNTYNATSIEFDFVSISNLIQFNYILASEEYFGNFPCQYSDGFAFLIKEAGTSNPYTNIAVIPGTNIPVNTNTIHDAIAGFCGPENASYFDGYTVGDTNYNGRTTVLTASAAIIPYTQYHIKLVIADQTDENYDSAVFIQGNSFNSTVDLGPDIVTCANAIEINGDIQNPLATYEWFLDGTLLSGESNSTLITSSSGEYEVEISIPLNDMDCIITDTVQITLSPVQSVSPIVNIEVCDDTSNDGIETFDLSLHDTEVLNVVPPSTYSISYHLSASDAQNGINPITSPIQNTSNPQTIYVKIEDDNSGCLAFSSFDLIINLLPDVANLSPIELCDDEYADGIVLIDLTPNIDNYTQGDPNLTVSFHYSSSDAENNINLIGFPYYNTNPNETLYVRVNNTATGCYNIGTQQINIIDRPALQVASLPPLNACESDTDGFEIFDLTVVLPDVLQGLTNVTTSFHESVDDANLGINPIANLTNYQNIVPNFQTVFIRVEDDTTGCASIIALELHTNVLITGTNITNYGECDEEPEDGIHLFDLDVVGSSISNGLQNFTIDFYPTQEDLDNQTNPIDTSILFEVNISQSVFINLGVPGCEFPNQIDLIVNPPIVLQPISPVDYCDTDQDGFTPIEMVDLDSLFINGMSNVNVAYYLTEDDAIQNINALPPFYTNVSNPETIYVKVSSSSFDCNDILPFEINIIPAPVTTLPSDLLICDNDQDAQSIFDLNTITPNVVSDTTDLTVSFHNTLDNANANSNSIVNITNYNTTSESIFVRVENNITGCFRVEEQIIIVNTLPAFSTITDYIRCEADGNQIADFLFSTKDDEILNGQINKEVLYFETQNDANNNLNSIDKNAIYNNTSSSQTIYVRVQNISDPSCFGISSFLIQVGSIPLFTPPTNYLICDDDSNDGVEVFDLTLIETQLITDSPESLNIAFYTSFEDATNETNAIPNSNYTNIENPQQIYARIENGTICHAVAEFGLNVVRVPTANIPTSMVQCDDDYDGVTAFDLTVSEIEILDIRTDDIEVYYFESIEDLETNSNQISNPSNYNNIANPQTIQIKVENLISGCYTITPLDLVVNIPPVINDLDTIEICNDNTSVYSLSDATDLLIDDLTDVAVSYFNTLNDAINNVNQLSNTYNYAVATQTIIVKAVNTITNCESIKPFDFIVHPLPIVNTPPDLVTCDNDYDNLFEFNLNDQDSVILGSQSITQYHISYFNSLNEAEYNNNPILTSVESVNDQTYYVRIENNSTGCFDTTSFKTIINPKPIVEIPDQPLCLNDPIVTVFAGETIFPGDSYLWSTNEITSSIDITQIGTYWVTVTSSEGCQTTETFNIFESEPATIESTEVVDFSDPNNVTITVSGLGDYLFMLDDQDPQSNGLFEYVSLGYHTITIIDVNGCSSITKDIVVVDAPKFFTPNNDSYFDTWHITGVETLEGTFINIFDRFGKHITLLKWNSPGWNGIYNGQLMPATDYWFVAHVMKNNISFEVKGHFALRR